MQLICNVRFPSFDHIWLMFDPFSLKLFLSCLCLRDEHPNCKQGSQIFLFHWNSHLLLGTASLKSCFEPSLVPRQAVACWTQASSYTTQNVRLCPTCYGFACAVVRLYCCLLLTQIGSSRLVVSLKNQAECLTTAYCMK